MKARTIVGAAAALSVFSIALYAFTGLHLWSAPQMPDDALRVILLVGIHVMPIVVFIAME